MFFSWKILILLRVDYSGDTYDRNTYTTAHRRNCLKFRFDGENTRKVVLLLPHQFILLEFCLSARAASQPELQLADSAVPHRLLIGRQLLRKLNLHRGFHTSQPADHSGSTVVRTYNDELNDNWNIKRHIFQKKEVTMKENVMLFLLSSYFLITKA
jgi:hypothetical protein